MPDTITEQDFNPEAPEIPGLDNEPYPDEESFDEQVEEVTETGEDQDDSESDSDESGPETEEEEEFEQEVDKDGDDEGEESEESEEEEGESEEEKVYFDDPELNAEVLRAIKRFGHLDPENPEHLKTLKSFADSQLYIKKLKGESGNKDDEDLTEFERQIKAELEKATGAEEKNDQQSDQGDDQRQDGGDPFGGVANNWRTAADAYNDLQDAWTKRDKNGVPDMERIANIENAMFAQRMRDFAMPVVVQIAEKIAEQRIQAQLGDVLPDIKQSTQAQRSREDHAFAVEELKRSEQFQDIDEMFKEIDGPPIVINGVEHPNTLLTQAIKKAPEILEIQKQSPDGDPRKSNRLTTIAQLRMAHRVMQDIKSAQAREREAADKAMKVGQKIEQRNAAKRKRQSVHKSADGNKSLEGGQGNKSYIDELNEVEPTSLAELFG